MTDLDSVHSETVRCLLRLQGEANMNHVDLASSDHAAAQYYLGKAAGLQEALDVVDGGAA